MSAPNTTEPGSTTSAYTVPNTIPALDLLFFVAYVLCFTVGTTGNSFALNFFLGKKRDIASVTYVFISLNDLLVGVLTLPLTLPVTTAGARQGFILERPDWFCNVWGLVWYVCGLMSVWLVAVVSITRCIVIVFPLSKLFIRIRTVVMVIVGYLGVVLVQATIPYWVGDIYDYMIYTAHCGWDSSWLDDYPTFKKVYSNILTAEYYIVVLPIVMSSFTTIFVLNRPRFNMSDSNKRVTTTILCFTVLYLVCNIPSCTFQLVHALRTTFGVSIPVDWMIPYTTMLNQVLVVTLNAALNPIIYVWRTRAFRNHVLRIVRCSSTRASLVPTLNQSIGTARRTRRKGISTPSPTLGRSRKLSYAGYAASQELAVVGLAPTPDAPNHLTRNSLTPYMRVGARNGGVPGQPLTIPNPSFEMELDQNREGEDKVVIGRGRDVDFSDVITSDNATSKPETIISYTTSVV